MLLKDIFFQYALKKTRDDIQVEKNPKKIKKGATIIL